MPRRKCLGCEIEDEPQSICWKCCCCSNLTGCIIIAVLFGLARIVSAIHIWRVLGDDKLYLIKEALGDSIGIVPNDEDDLENEIDTQGYQIAEKNSLNWDGYE